MASAAQVHSRLGGVEIHNFTRSSVHHCIRTMSMGEGGRSRTARHEFLEMVPNADSAASLMRACYELLCTLRGSAPPRRSVGTCAAGANTSDFLLDAVVFAGEVLHSGTGPGIVLLMVRISLLLLLPWGRLLLMVLWALSLPWVHLLWVILLLFATLTIVVALGKASAVATPATGSTSSPRSAAARMSNG